MKVLIHSALVLTAIIAQPAHTELQGIEYDGYLGIWYSNQPTQDEYVYKYSGGLGTYTADHIPMAVYAPAVNKTFFVYGGTLRGQNTLVEMVSYYDHTTGKLPRPHLLMEKGTDDAHDNPVLALDNDGYLWVFLSAHGIARPAWIMRSNGPYSIDGFTTILKTNFSYPQPWFLPGKGFLFLHTRYKDGRGLNWQTSPEGRTWTEPRLLAHMEEGHYQISWPWGEKVGTAFNYHPKGKGLNHRTNIYYVETGDFGETWRTVAGETLETPLRDMRTPALVHDYEADGLKVYICDLNYDAAGRPIVLHIVTQGWQPGPENGPRTWRTAHWIGNEWVLHDITLADSNYDMGSLYVAEDGAWIVVAPTEPGPQAYNPGGEVVLWESRDEGAHWQRKAQLTQNSAYNHTYARRPLNAQPGFWSFWADGDCRKLSASRLYFYDAAQSKVFRMPDTMPAREASPEPVTAPVEGEAPNSSPPLRP